MWETLLLVGGFALAMLFVKKQINHPYYLQQADYIFDRYAKRYNDQYGTCDNETKAVAEAIKQETNPD